MTVPVAITPSALRKVAMQIVYPEHADWRPLTLDEYAWLRDSAFGAGDGVAVSPIGVSTAFLKKLDAQVALLHPMLVLYPMSARDVQQVLPVRVRGPAAYLWLVNVSRNTVVRAVTVAPDRERPVRLVDAAQLWPKNC